MEGRCGPATEPCIPAVPSDAPGATRAQFLPPATASEKGISAREWVGGPRAGVLCLRPTEGNQAQAGCGVRRPPYMQDQELRGPSSAGGSACPSGGSWCTDGAALGVWPGVGRGGKCGTGLAGLPQIVPPPSRKMGPSGLPCCHSPHPACLDLSWGH